MTEYIGMNFNYAPRVTRASTATDSMSYLAKDKFDLVIVMLRIEDTDPISLGKSIKKTYPHMPVILLAFDETEIKQLSQKLSPSAIDRVFIWSGDASVFPAIIKYVEDRKNAMQDIIKGDVRAIILIEDSPRMYSILLPMIYIEIYYLTKNLMNKTLNSTYRSLHLRGRLKVLLTPNYETAVHFSEKYGDTGGVDLIKHYETIQIQDSKGKIFVPKGKIVDSTFKSTFLDSGTNQLVEVSPIEGISYRTYEERLQDDKRNINILESRFLSYVIDEVETLLDYEPSSEYINPKLKRGSNPNLG